jgi:hypothetical protein
METPENICVLRRTRNTSLGSCRVLHGGENLKRQRDKRFKFTGRQHANPDGESATNWATKTGQQKVCQRHNNQPENAGVSPQVQKGTVGLNQHFSLRRVSLS